MNHFLATPASLITSSVAMRKQWTDRLQLVTDAEIIFVKVVSAVFSEW